MESSDVRVKDNRDDLPIFIHSELDDYGLSNAEFRVYGRLARRAGSKGVAKESVPNMAANFMVSDRTVRRCLQVLVRCRLVAEHLRPGRPTEYALNPRTVWADKKDLPAIRESVFDPTLDTTTPSRHVRGDMRDGGVPSVMSRPPRTPQTGEGTPVQGTPRRRSKSGAKPATPRDPLLDNAHVVAYRNVCRLTPNPEQRRLIADTVKDGTLWDSVLRKFMQEGQKPQHVDWLIERYGKANGGGRPVYMASAK